jgi:hypothetical protein
MEKTDLQVAPREMPGNEPEPVRCKEGRGQRNFDCMYYESCLNKAARSMWSGFTCEECPFYR